MFLHVHMAELSFIAVRTHAIISTHFVLKHKVIIIFMMNQDTIEEWRYILTMQVEPL